MRRKTKGHSVLRQTWQVRCLPKYKGEQEIGRVQMMDWGFFSASHAKGRSCSLWSFQGDGRVPPTSEDFPECVRTAGYDRKPREKKNAACRPNESCLLDGEVPAQWGQAPCQAESRRNQSHVLQRTLAPSAKALAQMDKAAGSPLVEPTALFLTIPLCSFLAFLHCRRTLLSSPSGMSHCRQDPAWVRSGKVSARRKYQRWPAELPSCRRAGCKGKRNHRTAAEDSTVAE